jgi:uroporphyrinogen-III synthase
MNTSTGKIVLTRTRVQSQPLAHRLTALGYAVALFPLLEIVPLPENSNQQRIFQATLNNLSTYAMAVFVSPNAIHAVFKNGLKWPSEVAIAVMGEGSRAALAQYGISEKSAHIYCPATPASSVDSANNSTTPQFRADSEALLRELDLDSLRGRNVVIFRAETGRELLADALAEHDIHVVKVIAYRRFAPLMTVEDKQLLSDLLASDSTWVVASSEALRTLANCIQKLASDVDVNSTNVVASQQLTLWVSHHRIAETAEKCGFNHIRLIGSGDENLLLALQS